MGNRGQGPAGFSWGEALNAALPIVGLTAGLYARPGTGQNIASFASLMALQQERDQRRKEDQAAQAAIAQQLGQLGYKSDPAMSAATQIGFAGVQGQKQERERLAAERASGQAAYTKLAGLRRPDRPLEERERELEQYEGQYGLLPGLEPAFSRLRAQFAEERKREIKAGALAKGFEREQEVPLLPAPPAPEMYGVDLGRLAELRPSPPSQTVREVPPQFRRGVQQAQEFVRETGEEPTPEAQRVRFGLPPAGIVGKEPTYQTKDFTDAAGNVVQVTTRLNPVTGAVEEIGRIPLGPIGASQKPPSAVMTPERIEDMLKRRNLVPGTTEFDEAYANVARQVGVPGLGVYGVGQMLPPILPPIQTPRPQGTSAPPVSQSPGEKRPMIPAPMMPEQGANLVHRETLTPPPPGTPMADIRKSGEYVVMPTQAINKLPAIKMFGSVLNSMESVMRKRPDLWPVLTGDARIDAPAVTLARAKYIALTSRGSPLFGTDPDVATFESNRIGIPTASRSFTEVGNLAEKEQAINAEAMALGAGGLQASRARLNNIRNHVNNGLPAGLTFRLKVQSGRAASRAEYDEAVRASGGDKGKAREVLRRRGIDTSLDLEEPQGGKP